MDELTPLQRAVAKPMSQGKLARAIGVSQGAVWQWLQGRKIPPAYCIEIERVTDGLVRCEELNSDAEWTREDGRPFYRETPEVRSAA